MTVLGWETTEGTALSLGRSFVGLATAASGVLQLATGDFVRLVRKLPAWVPAPSAWAYVSGIVLILIGLAILSGRRTRLAASVLAALIVLVVMLLYTPAVASNPWAGFMWTAPLKAFALVGGAVILAARGPDEPTETSTLVRTTAKVEPLAAVFLSAFLVVCGMQHFAYRNFVATLVPSWVPGGQMFWTYFAGVALIAGGAGILVPRTARLAALLSALMIFLWVPMVHIPRALFDPGTAGETAGVFEALAISGVALLVAGTRSRQ